MSFRAGYKTYIGVGLSFTISDGFTIFNEPKDLCL